ncbi:sigma-70 family RNA polymerase sigma factor [Cellulomonas sp. APG4]|uniref:sigma-70 family RNA polymerase sigma factor n=1 Tax=Cellulomonas sp. APG4 TaxID=1538656 RepID=UPI00137A9F0F|nr:sigma-70 family RNA polymerase sigma factor [Cellulomonas sp. APG4]NCT90615.1 sigma-70 family RNA polymerase sigma factor [Cellulomonas sp. APG4]
MDQTELADQFELHRRRLVGVAYRMLGSVAEAEDVVQDAWVRLARTEAQVDELGAWLTTVVSRLCLDRLRSARARREQYVGPWLPEPLVHDLAGHAVGPAELVEVDESVRLALLVVLERLSAEQRVAFVLHDVFDVPFGEVAEVLGTSPAAARQHASRARRAVHAEAPATAPPPAGQSEVVEAFFRAAAGGDLHALTRTLAPDVVLISDGGGRARAALRPIHGTDKVARFLLGLAGYYPGVPFSGRPVLVNGEIGLVVQVRPDPAGPPDVSVVVPHVGADGLVHGIDVLRNPEKLGDLEALARLGGG